MNRVSMIALAGMPMVGPGDDLAGLILDGIARAGETLGDGDVVVVAQKIVSKAENRYVDLAGVVPSAEAERIGGEVGKDPRFVEVLLSESASVVRARPGGVMIMAHKLGFVMANAGIDHSNIVQEAGTEERLLLLPVDPDGSARALAAALKERTGATVGVVINDSFGRPFRVGTCGVAVGVAGIAAAVDKRGDTDLFGNVLRVTIVGQADEIAAAASLVMGQADEGVPAVLMRGLDLAMLPADADPGVRPLLRNPEEDLFR